jgi:CheY-like chemotaxis protein
VLIIDDHRDSIDALATLLEQRGHRVLTAFDGRHGVEIAKNEHPSVIICDIGLPSMDGYQVARTLREEKSTAAITLFALSGSGTREAIRRAREAGFDRHLTKPVDVASLLDLVSTAGAD